MAITVGFCVQAQTIPPEARAVDITMTSATGDGTTWGTAYKYLQDALIEASDPTNGITEIWVADGTYYADDRADGSIGGRSATFALIDGVWIMGGFAGIGTNETDKNERKPYTNITILSGDIDQDDTGSTPGSNNSYHVVSAEDRDPSAIIDGFVITRGYADDAGHVAAHLEPGTGGGIVIYVTNAGDASVISNPVILRCTFKNNSAIYGGGAFMSSRQLADIQFQNCRFHDNYANKNDQDEGGDGAGACLAGATFTTAGFVNCVFHDNTAEGQGGAIRGENQSLIRVFNCTIVQNSSGDDSGGIDHEAPEPPSLIAGPFGNGTHLVNGILWDNTGPNPSTYHDQVSGARQLSHSCIKGYPVDSQTANPTIINGNPLFENETANDFRITCSPMSPCINTGHPANYVGFDPYDVDQDGKSEDTPDYALTRRDRHITDMGAYEAHVPERCSGDVDENEVVNVTDLLLVIGDW